MTHARLLATRTGAAVVGSALAIGLLTGCGDSGDDADQDGPTADSSATETTDAATASDYLPVPTGVMLTDPGTSLGLGEKATIAWRPRQDSVVALDVTVDRIDRTTFEESFDGWVVTEQMRGQVPYFVQVEATNVGADPVSGLLVPLYGFSAAASMYEPLDFREQPFDPCPGGNLPKRLEPDESADLCFVYLLPADQELASAAFDPDGDLPPVTWSGDVTELEKPKDKTNKGNDEQDQDAGPQDSPSG